MRSTHERRIIHMDLDAFFASVEVLLNPDLKGRPVVVGARPGQRGVVTSASYEARRYGVRSAMPIARAARLCPDAVFLPTRHQLYEQYSRQVMALLGEFTPLVEQASVDEAYLDVTGSQRLFGDAEAIASNIQRRVREEIGLPCSAGVAGTKLVAKIASARAKPAGVIVVPPGEEAAFLAPLPIESLPGIGPRAAERLRSIGIERVGQLAQLSAQTLRQLFGSHGDGYRTLALGGPFTPVQPEREPKQVSHEQTFDRDIDDLAGLRRRLLQLCDAVGHRLRRRELLARTVTLKLRYADFTTLTRSLTLTQPTDLDERLYQAAAGLLERVWRGGGVRLLGVAASGLVSEESYQADLFDPRGRRRERLARTIDAIRERFGEQAIGRASLQHDEE